MPMKLELMFQQYIDRFTSGHDPFRNWYRLHQLLLLCQIYVPIKGARSRGEPCSLGARKSVKIPLFFTVTDMKRGARLVGSFT